jgi:hypothetical protein
MHYPLNQNETPPTAFKSTTRSTLQQVSWLGIWYSSVDEKMEGHKDEILNNFTFEFAKNQSHMNLPKLTLLNIAQPKT